MPCDMADVLHIAAIDIGTIRADHYQMDFCTIPIAVKMSDIITELFSEHGVRKAVLFGSYAKGTATEHSDVDLLVDSGLRGLKFFGLLESVTCALNLPVDLLDVTQIEHGSKVEHEIQNSGVAIYGQ